MYRFLNQEVCKFVENINPLKLQIMALWKIPAKNNWNWGSDKQMVKGMFIEMVTRTTAPPLGQTK